MDGRAYIFQLPLLPLFGFILSPIKKANYYEKSSTRFVYTIPDSIRPITTLLFNSHRQQPQNSIYSMTRTIDLTKDEVHILRLALAELNQANFSSYENDEMGEDELYYAMLEVHELDTKLSQLQETKK